MIFLSVDAFMVKDFMQRRAAVENISIWMGYLCHAMDAGYWMLDSGNLKTSILYLASSIAN
jgi:hypothetical protein